MPKNIKNYLFTSESVASGHPDKICDAISDAILDAALKIDPYSRTGIEVIAGANKICLFGEIKTKADIDFKKIAKQKIVELGYNNPSWGFSDQSEISCDIHQQSPEISIGVDQDGAGDQGMMFGYANKQTEAFMPLPITIAHDLTKQIDSLRRNRQISWLRPDGKAQVTVKFINDQAISVEKVVLAVAHDEAIAHEDVSSDAIKKIIEPILNKYNLSLPDKNSIIINGTGVWHIPGPDSDAGLTGRKIVVDTYGGYARVGGGAFSGKDPSKVDRSGAYAARYIAKNIVANDLAEECEVGLAYVIGQPKPLMQTINTFGTSSVSEKVLHDFKDKLLDLSVIGIIDGLNLRRPIYQQTSAYGHFGKVDLPWEQIVNL